MISNLWKFLNRLTLWTLLSWPYSRRSRVQVQPQGGAAAQSLLPAASDVGKKHCDIQPCITVYAEKKVNQVH